MNKPTTIAAVLALTTLAGCPIRRGGSRDRVNLFYPPREHNSVSEDNHRHSSSRLATREFQYTSPGAIVRFGYNSRRDHRPSYQPRIFSTRPTRHRSFNNPCYQGNSHQGHYQQRSQNHNSRTNSDHSPDRNRRPQRSRNNRQRRR